MHKFHNVLEYPLRLEILLHAPTAFLHCRHCEVVWGEAGLAGEIRREQISTGLPDDLLREHARLSAGVAHRVAVHGDRVEVEVVDAVSVRGFWRSLRHRVGRYPAVVVGGRERFSGAELEAAAAAVARRLADASPA